MIQYPVKALAALLLMTLAGCGVHAGFHNVHPHGRASFHHPAAHCGHRPGQEVLMPGRISPPPTMSVEPSQ